MRNPSIYLMDVECRITLNVPDESLVGFESILV